MNWHLQQPKIFLIQETHLDETGYNKFRAKASSSGLHTLGGLGSRPDPRPKGGVGIIAPATEHGRKFACPF